MPRYEVRIDGDVCKGCELCNVFCPKKIVVMSAHVNKKGYSPATVEKQEECIGCKSCAVVCPDGAISIYREDVA